MLTVIEKGKIKIIRQTDKEHEEFTFILLRINHNNQINRSLSYLSDTFSQDNGT